VSVYQLAIVGWKQVIYDNINPFSEPPESEMKYPSIVLFVERIPFLLAVIWNDLYSIKPQDMIEKFTFLLCHLIPQFFNSSENRTCSNKPAVP